jgi:hypothetical protein
MAEKEFVYRTTVDLTIARMYNSRNCKECHGKGYFVAHIPPDGDPFKKDVENYLTHTYCKCVIKNIRLYG